MKLNNCSIHTEEESKYVCISQQSPIGQRKLCEICQQSQLQDFPNLQILNNEQFKTKFQQEFQEITNKNKIDEFMMIFTNKFKSLKESNSELYTEIEIKFNSLCQDIRELGSEYTKYEQYLNNIELNEENITEILENYYSSKFQRTKMLKHQIYENIQNILPKLEQILQTDNKKLIQDFIYQIKNVDEFKNEKISWILKGETLFGIKHGYFHHEVMQSQNKIILQKSKLIFNIKHGVWCEMQGNIKMQGQYDMGQRLGQWNYFWRQKIIGGGMYNENGLKNGIWKEPIFNLQNFVQNQHIIWCGQYKDGVKIGYWKLLNEGQEIGGGEYNEQGIKEGFWNDVVDQRYNKRCQIIWKGTYENGLRVGNWKIFGFNKEIGGGKYNQEGKKIGFWKIINQEQYRKDCKVIFQGEYDNDVKVGEWKIYYKKKQIGGGTYGDNEIYDGLWKVINEEYYQFFCQVSFEGQFKNGIRVGKWNIYSQDQLIGGGNYNEHGIKIGLWRDIIDTQHNNFCQVIYEGEYNDGVKVGKWKIYHDQKEIGNGEYDQNGKKIGQWIDISEDYYDYSQKQVWEGLYNQGIKVGLWKWHYSFMGSYEGQGEYNEKGIKIGKWLDYKEDMFNMQLLSQIQGIIHFIWEGQYNEGVKIGEWIQKFQDKNIGGGQFNQLEQKNGNWKEINEELIFVSRQVIWEGQYKDNIKIGKWKLYYEDKLCGGGEYNEDGQKIGEWREIYEDFFTCSCIAFYEGTYQNGVRVGKWKIFDMEEQIGGGEYNNFGLKIGEWKDVDDDISQYDCVIQKFNYDNEGIQIIDQEL